MTGLTYDTAVQLDEAYRRMAAEARYRPAAPSDGFGNITTLAAALDLDAECLDYARHFAAEEDDRKFSIGCCFFSTRPATVFAIEAARLLCGGDVTTARKLLLMTAGELEGRKDFPVIT